ncbi:MAG: DUF3857 domain-containing transglutaminase family protein [Bernardetiaceae bacterium]
MLIRFVWIAGWLWAATALGQSTPDNPWLKDMQATYPDHPAVFLLKKKTYRLVQEGSQQWFIYEDYHSEILHLREGSADWADDQITYSQFSEIIGFNAYTLVPTPDGGHQKLSYIHFSDHNWVQEDVFYDDTRVRKFILPKISVGVITVLRYTRKIKDAHFWNGFFFSSALPIEQAAVQVEFPDSVDVIPEMFHLEKLEELTASQSANSFGWVARRVPAQQLGLPKSPPLRQTEPHVVFRLGSFGRQRSFLRSYHDLCRWYYTFVEAIDKRADWGLVDRTAEITAGVRSEREAAERIFAWVQQHIRYLAFEEGWSGFIPEMPLQVCQKGYGDCKSMSSLLVGLLRTAGIRAHFAWIGSRDLPYTYAQLPTPLSDDHMIVMALLEGDTLWLDATSPYRPFGTAAHFVQGKEALVGLGPDSCLIAAIPQAPAAHNQIKDSCHFYFEQTHIRAEGVLRLSGYAKTVVAEVLQAHQPDELQNILPRLLQYGHPSVQLQHVNIRHFDGTPVPLEIHYTLLLKDYQRIFRNEVYFNPHVSMIWKEKFLTADRRVAWVNSYAFEQQHIYTFHLPEGFRNLSTLKDDAWQSPDFGYTCRYERDGQKSMTLRQHFYNNGLAIQPEQFADWNRMIEQLTRLYQENVLLAR